MGELWGFSRWKGWKLLNKQYGVQLVYVEYQAGSQNIWVQMPVCGWELWKFSADCFNLREIGSKITS